jgi:hypothetical protein
MYAVLEVREVTMRSRLIRIGTYCLGLAIALISVGHVVMAGGPIGVPVPEIDGTTLVGGLGLLTAGVLILRSRWK